jgi:hypothetical protein
MVVGPCCIKMVAVSDVAWIHEAVELMRTHALNRRLVNWDVLVPELLDHAERDMAAGREETSLAPAFRALGDEHSFLLTSTTIDAVGGTHEEELPSGALVESGVRCLAVPAVWSPDWEGEEIPYTAAGQQALQLIECAGDLVIDLRGNTGGNCYPMLAIIAPLLGVGRLAGYEGGKRRRWIRYDGDSIRVGALRFNSFPPTQFPAARIAVLSGARTGSSGEIALLAVRDRRRARSFGSPTAGFTTANGRYPLSNGMTLFLAAASAVSSTGRSYRGVVTPHEETAESEALQAAVRWLRAHRTQ